MKSSEVLYLECKQTNNKWCYVSKQNKIVIHVIDKLMSCFIIENINVYKYTVGIGITDIK